MHLTLILQLSFIIKHVRGETCPFIYQELAYAHDLVRIFRKDLGIKLGIKSHENDTLEIEFHNVSGLNIQGTDKYIFKKLS